MAKVIRSFRSFPTRAPVTRDEFGPDYKSELHTLADLVGRLTVDHRDPEIFYERRSALQHEIRKLAYKIGNGVGGQGQRRG